MTDSGSLLDRYKTCDECGKAFPSSDVMQVEGKNICSACKSSFVQRLSEGAGLSVKGLERVEVFPRVNVWLVLLLSLITLGIYQIFWFADRAFKMNRVMPENPISPALIQGYIGVVIVSFISGIVVGIMTMTASADAIVVADGVDTVISLVSTIVYLFLLFKFRNRLNEMAGAVKGEKEWCSGILTFFFSLLYLQYKINRYREAAAIV